MNGIYYVRTMDLELINACLLLDRQRTWMQQCALIANNFETGNKQKSCIEMKVCRKKKDMPANFLFQKIIMQEDEWKQAEKTRTVKIDI